MSETRSEVLARLGTDQFDFTKVVSATFAVTEHIHTRVSLDRLDERDEHGNASPAEYRVWFDRGSGPSEELVHPDQIPNLIDALTLMHREWVLELNGE